MITLKRAAYFGRLAARERAGIYDSQFANHAKPSQTNQEPKNKPAKPQDDVKWYNDADKFLDGFTGIFQLKRRHLPDANTVKNNMHHGISVFQGPDGKEYLVYRNEGKFGISTKPVDYRFN